MSAAFSLYSHFDNTSVKMVLATEREDLMRIQRIDGVNRVVANFTPRQAIALAYKLLHAANGGTVDLDVAPASTVGVAQTESKNEKEGCQDV